MKATKKYRSTKRIEIGSAAFRQWRSTHSHCQYVHGYNLTCQLVFEADTLDIRNWVADFGGFKEIKSMLQAKFDHKLVVAADDPLLDTFKLLEQQGGCELTIMDAVGCEKFAEYSFKLVDEKISTDRIRLISVEIFEHDGNSAIYTV